MQRLSRLTGRIYQEIDRLIETPATRTPPTKEKRGNSNNLQSKQGTTAPFPLSPPQQQQQQHPNTREQREGKYRREESKFGQVADSVREPLDAVIV
jgi:hypothetical protein